VGLGQAEFTGEAILKHAPKAFDAAFACGLCAAMKVTPSCWSARPELRGLALAGELFVERPVIVVAGEDAAAIAVEGDGTP